MDFVLYNTMTRKKEAVLPLDGKTLRVYTCGPTVYDYAHIGNFRTYVFEDLLRRAAKFFGMDVEQVMNFTDVDDKTIKGALAAGVTLEEYTKKYKEAFLHDLNVLGIEDVEHRPAATEYVDAMITMVQGLFDKGYAYKGSDGSIYFSIAKFKGYGKLSHLPLEDLKTGASERTDNDEYDKEHASDFVLWKAYDKDRDGEIFWESTFGPGRPGWHLECSAMAKAILGNTIDIHCGGVDNIFPHHENEIAQSEAYTGEPFSKMWVHSEYLIVENRKMSKSLGNFYTLKDLIDKGYTGKQIRYMLLQTHYRMQLNFTIQELDAVKTSLERIHSFVTRMEEIQGDDSSNAADGVVEKTTKAFSEALADDINIAKALAAIFDMIREVNAIADKGSLSTEEAQKILAMVKSFDAVLGIMTPEKEETPQDLLDALEQRQQARNDKDWKRADELRDIITSRGYTIEDTPKGARLKKDVR
ncbi:MAG: cysteine--tRNA ligase [Waddliaceae bacterium]|jgi:cysteinyl-tRNA synthetase|nr:cysteine--tRNA ligase [Waddliaceae bacterium]MBT3579273.1 cysteine--tRNA ligase [Waddliaceae bacterium]MBT6928458.1 cysteine--tRNA ligase [Waddliaceae bacterium]MBT7264104.1 cysteine--tRNA ligase [Waddliaceae bacterium]